MTAPPNQHVRPPWEALARPRSFWLGFIVLIFLTGMCIQRLDNLPAFLLIAISALLPACLWCHGQAHGIPIYPIFTLGTLWTFGLPMLAGVTTSPVEPCWQAAAIIASMNLSGTASWLVLTRRVMVSPQTYFGFAARLADRLFLSALAMEILFQMLTSSLDLGLDPALFSILRALVLAWGSLAVFVLGFRAGRRELSVQSTRCYFVLLIGVLLSTLSSVLLAGSLFNGVLALLAFALGCGTMPLVPSVVFLALALFLQAGKSSIREVYWPGIEGAPVTFSRFPGFLADWLTLSSRHVFTARAAQVGLAAQDASSEPQSLIERASLLPLFLTIRKETPSEIPYLNGATYAIIPGLLVPRIFNADKQRSHFGTYLLSIRYGLQRPEDTSMTTIGFGLVNEALANFGWPGCWALGTFLGTFYGAVARWSSAFPIFSLRALFSVLVLAIAIETEFTAGVFAATLFQSCCALLFLSFATRRIHAPLENRRVSPSNAHVGKTPALSVPHP